MIESSRMRRFLLGVGLVTLFIHMAAPCCAESSTKIVAEQLFKEAHDLLDRGDIELACAKLRASDRLEPAGGTALLLGICLEHQGNYASAWAALRRARALAVRDGRQDRVDVADDSLRLVEPKLSHLTVSVSDQARVPGLVVALDGVELDDAARDVAIPVDPGSHELRASAPGRKSYRASIEIPGTDHVVIEPLVAEPALVAQATPRVEATSGNSNPKGNHDGPTQTAVQDSPTSNNTARTTSLLTVGALGITGLAITGAYGIGAMVAEERKPMSCSTTDMWCVTQAHSLEEKRNRDATIATIAGSATVVAALAVAALAWLYPSSRPRSSNWTLTPTANSTMGIGGQF